MKNVAAIILAAGKGTRMKSALAKVLHPVCGRPMVGYVLDVVRGSNVKKAVAVLGFGFEEAHAYIKNVQGTVVTVRQKQLLGTADAVKTGLRRLGAFDGIVLILYGDMPLLTAETVQKLYTHHIRENAAMTVLTAVVEKPSGYGRIVRDAYGAICGIVEEKDADDFQKGIKEINTGIMCVGAKSLVSALRKIKKNERKNEFYLTDAIGILYKDGALVETVTVDDSDEAMGVNSQAELAKAHRIMQQRIQGRLLEDGVKIVSPESTQIGYGVAMGAQTVIYPFTVVEKNAKIGSNCSIGPYAYIHESAVVKNNTRVGAFEKF